MRVCILMLTPDLCRPHYLTEQPTSFLAAQWKWIPLSAPSRLSSAPHNHFRLMVSLYSGHAASNDGWSHNPCLKRNLSAMHYKAFFILLMLSNERKYKCLQGLQPRSIDYRSSRSPFICLFFSRLAQAEKWTKTMGVWSSCNLYFLGTRGVS